LKTTVQAEPHEKGPDASPRGSSGPFFVSFFLFRVTGKRASQNQARVFTLNPGQFLTLKPAQKFNTGKFTNEGAANRLGERTHLACGG